ncbi:nucleoside hydrolase [Clostridium tarantellae]|uniref:Nucleoside hydrolase n=1 Tax=Clostridium tarantellae TaxID=39493 RepID=A0A6I1MHB3_9CLOT|nr:nucleoside hydrolase [Clostridium tarantellae]MPQ42224.1 nucleoside hydrolase [Clostridium tarantellae]
MKKRKVIIDCDPGIDDALALILALKSEELDVVGITTVSGNVDSIQGAKNVLKVLKLMGRLDIPVYIGEFNPIVKKLVTAQDTHGIDGLGETFYSEVYNELLNEGAVDFILNSLNNIKDLSIIALGPLTNLYKALKKDYVIFNKVEEVVSMGGTYKSHGNCSPVAEFNYWVDPHAAGEFIKKFKKPFTMVGLDVTREIVLTPNLIELIKQFNTSIGNFIVDITKFYVDFHWNQERTLGCVINDPLAVEYFINKSICNGFDSYVDIVNEGIAVGQTIVDKEKFYNKTPNCKILYEVDAQQFMKSFLKKIFSNNKNDIDLILNNKKYGS